MHLGVELIIPQQGNDEFGQQATASATQLSYSLDLKPIKDSSVGERDEIRLVSEELVRVAGSDYSRALGFSSSPEWLASAVGKSRRGVPFISTKDNLILRHQDKPGSKGWGQTWKFPIHSLPRTVLSSARNAQEGPTAVLVRQTLQDLSLLQLEPSAMRKPDDVHRAPSQLGPNGAHLPATLYRLAHEKNDPQQIFSTVANRVAQLGCRKNEFSKS